MSRQEIYQFTEKKSPTQIFCVGLPLFTLVPRVKHTSFKQNIAIAGVLCFVWNLCAGSVTTDAKAFPRTKAEKHEINSKCKTNQEITLSENS